MNQISNNYYNKALEIQCSRDNYNNNNNKIKSSKVKLIIPEVYVRNYYSLNIPPNLKSDSVPLRLWLWLCVLRIGFLPGLLVAPTLLLLLVAAGLLLVGWLLLLLLIATCGRRLLVPSLCVCVCMYVCVCLYMLMRCAEGRRKQARPYNQHKAKQHDTTKAVIFLKINELPRVGQVGFEPMTLRTPNRQMEPTHTHVHVSLIHVYLHVVLITV